MPAYLVGYAALMDRFTLDLPLHHDMAAISTKSHRAKEGGWVIYPSALRPADGTVDHLVFALKYEGVQLLTLKRIFEAFASADLERAARSKPTSAYLRRLCFLYEWLTGLRLAVPDSSGGAYVPVLDARQQYGTTRWLNRKRFRIRDNLPGTSGFCPLVFRTHALDDFIGKDLAGRARQIVESAPKELIARAAAFLLLSDSKASFAIEGENPPKDRIARWGAVIGRAGQIDLSTSALVELQRQLIGDDRFVHVGLRQEGGFVGRHDAFGQPEPEHISAPAPDLQVLLDGLSKFDRRGQISDLHPVLAAASLAFGFVYIHPFEDGNGRIHRFLMHHVLADRGFTPREIVFPISSVIYDDIPRYKDVLESVSRPLLAHIKWRPTEKGNIQVLNDTSDFYRFFDATAHAEYLFRCIERSIEKHLPEELAFLEHRDTFHRQVTAIVDMGERTIDVLMRFLKQGGGRLSRRARENEFGLLEDDEAAEIEDLYAELFG